MGLQGGISADQEGGAGVCCDGSQGHRRLRPVKGSHFSEVQLMEETYRVRFWSMACAQEESYTEMATRVIDLERKWTRKCADVDEVQ